MEKVLSPRDLLSYSIYRAEPIWSGSVRRSLRPAHLTVFQRLRLLDDSLDEILRLLPSGVKGQTPIPVNRLGWNGCPFGITAPHDVRLGALAGKVFPYRFGTMTFNRTISGIGCFRW